MNALDQIEVNDYHTLRSEISRQPWLTDDERIALIVNDAVSYAVENATREMWSDEQYQNDVKDARREGAEELEDELRYIIETVGDGDDDDSTILKRVIAHLDKVRS